MSESRPNVLFVICHDFGKHMGCYGRSTVRTPNIDALAAAGVRFDRHFATAPQCSPSRAAIMTGRYPHANGVMGLAHGDFAFALNDDEKHVAQIFGAAGYHTFAFGRQHATSLFERCGFGEVKSKQRDGEGVVADVEEFLTSRAAGEAPFYAHVCFAEPHRPWIKEGVEADETLGVELPGYVGDWPESRREFAELQGACHYADTQIGRVLKSLEAAGLAENTIVVFTVDHGIAMPRAKCTLYDPGLETGLIVRWPGRGIGGGRVVESMTSNVDILGSLLELCGLSVPANVQGHSFAPALRGEAYQPRTEIFGEMTYHQYYDPMRAIRTDRWKLVVNFQYTLPVHFPRDVLDGAIAHRMIAEGTVGSKPAFEVYDLQADPWEQENLAGMPDVADVEKDLKRRLVTWMEETGDPLLAGPVPNPAYVGRLAALREA